MICLVKALIRCRGQLICISFPSWRGVRPLLQIFSLRFVLAAFFTEDNDKLWARPHRLASCELESVLSWLLLVEILPLQSIASNRLKLPEQSSMQNPGLNSSIQRSVAALQAQNFTFFVRRSSNPEHVWVDILFFEAPSRGKNSASSPLYPTSRAFAPPPATHTRVFREALWKLAAFRLS